eukprot:1159735-Pelagomonas_calceolata.AAC.6
MSLVVCNARRCLLSCSGALQCPSPYGDACLCLLSFDDALLCPAVMLSGGNECAAGRDGATPSPRPTPLVPPSQSSRPSSSLSSLRSSLVTQPPNQPLNPSSHQQPASQPSNQQQGAGSPCISHPQLSPVAMVDSHHRHPSSSSFSSEVGPHRSYHGWAHVVQLRSGPLWGLQWLQVVVG